MIASLPTSPYPPSPPNETAAALPDRSFHALGTEVRVVGRGAAKAERAMRRLESLLTRFQPSPLTALNERGEAVDPPEELVAALRHALAVARETDGLVTPLILPALRWAGYRTSWPAPPRPEGGPPPRVGDWHDVRVSETAVRLPPGAEVDLGGTGKSWIAERCFERLVGNALLDAGGDLISRATEPVAIDVAHPLGAEPLQLVLPAGRWGVATSGILARSWHGGHHLIDPRTSRPAETRFVQATAVHGDLRRAETAAKVALLAPERRDLLTEPAVLIAFDPSGAPWRHHDDGCWRRI